MGIMDRVERFGYVVYPTDEWNDMIIVDRLTRRWSYELWSAHGRPEAMVEYLNVLHTGDEEIVEVITRYWEDEDDEDYNLFREDRDRALGTFKREDIWRWAAV